MDIFYFREVEIAPVSAMQVKKETHNNPELSEVMDIIVKGQPAGDSVCLKHCLGAFCSVWVFAMGMAGDHAAVTSCKNVATATFWT